MRTIMSLLRNATIILNIRGFKRCRLRRPITFCGWWGPTCPSSAGLEPEATIGELDEGRLKYVCNFVHIKDSLRTLSKKTIFFTFLYVVRYSIQKPSSELETVGRQTEIWHFWGFFPAARGIQWEVHRLWRILTKERERERDKKGFSKRFYNKLII